MLGSTQSMILRLRTSALAFSFGIFVLAACASPENAVFDDPLPEEDAGTDVKQVDAKPDVDDDTDAGDDGGQGGSGGGPSEPDTCGLSACPAPTYEDFEKCCTSADLCGYRNGPSGFCYDAEDQDPGPPGAGGGGP